MLGSTRFLRAYRDSLARAGSQGAAVAASRAWISVGGGRAGGGVGSRRRLSGKQDEGEGSVKGGEKSGRTNVPSGGSRTDMMDGVNWGAGDFGSSVSDADSWGSGHEGRFRNPVVEQEQRMFQGLAKLAAKPEGMRWRANQMILPMGEQRRKPFRPPLPGSSTDDVKLRKAKASGEEDVPRPARIILVRHGESQGNSDEGVYGRVSDWRISLTDRGRTQAAKAAEYVKGVVGDREVFFYYSPYSRAVETCQLMLESFDPAKVRGIREDPRMAEQQFGNLQDPDAMKKVKNERHVYGRFFYRFPTGEAGLDVYSRVTSFIATIKRDHIEEDCCVVIVTHGLALRLFLMAWCRWTVEQFESTTNPPNCGVAVLERVDGKYRLSQETCDMIGCENDGPTSPCVAEGLWDKVGGPKRAPRADRGNVASLRDVKQ